MASCLRCCFFVGVGLRGEAYQKSLPCLLFSTVSLQSWIALQKKLPCLLQSVSACTVDVLGQHRPKYQHGFRRQQKYEHPHGLQRQLRPQTSTLASAAAGPDSHMVHGGSIAQRHQHGFRWQHRPWTSSTNKAWGSSTDPRYRHTYPPSPHLSSPAMWHEP